MKKIIALIGALIVGSMVLFANGHCQFSEEYQEQVLYFDAWQYLEYWYSDMPEEIKDYVCEDVSASFLNPEMKYEEALANCVEFYVALYR